MENSNKSFLLYIDSLNILDEMTDDQAGQLFKAIRAYHTGAEHESSAMINIAMVQFKTYFKQNNIKYNETCRKRKIAGALGGKQKVANASKC